MSAIANISSALSYDAVESMLASGRSLADCFAFAATAAGVAHSDSDCPVSSATVLASNSATVVPGKKA